LVVGLTACQENLNAPGVCPDLCPGEQIVVRDTILPALEGGDSTFFGYLSRSSRTVLLVSDQLPAGEYRSFVKFPKQRSDSIPVEGTTYAFTIDTVSISFNLQARDSTATGLTLYLHRIPLATDTTVTFEGLEGLIAAGEVIDSIQVADSVKSGRIEAILAGDELAKVATPADDSGQIAIGLRVRASKPTGISLSVDAASSVSAPSYQLRGHVPIADTTKRRQATLVRPDSLSKFGLVGNRDLAANADPNLLYIGGPRAARSLLRFAIPEYIRDSTQILRATLLLTPAVQLDGLPNNPSGDSVAVRGVQVDLGSKSPPIVAFGLQAAGPLTHGTATPVSVDLGFLALQWQADGGPPTVVFLANSDEVFGAGFMQPVFFSTRSPIGQPKLQITYGLPTRPGRP
jgi:hypothetical protein